MYSRRVYTEIVAERIGRGVPAYPRAARRAVYARGVAARRTGRRHGVAVLRALVIAAVHGAVSGITLRTNRFVHAVRRAAGAVFSGVHRSVQTVGITTDALAVVRAARYVVICACKIVAQRRDRC